MFSVSIIAKDSEKTIAQCLSSVKNFTNDIVVIIDPRTSDNTEAIAKSFGCRVFKRDFDDFASQKNYASSKTKYDWVFSLDADEELQSTDVVIDESFSAFSIKRTNFIFGKAIRHSNSDPNPIVRLYNKNSGEWKGLVHEQLRVDGPVGKLSGHIIHHNYQTVEQFISKSNQYSSLEKSRTNPIYDFLRRYVWHAGFLDGWHGLFFCYLQAIYHTMVWAKNI